MLVLEYKIKAKPAQYRAIDEAIRTVQFIRNKCLRYWIDTPRETSLNRFDFSKYSTELRNEFGIVYKSLSTRTHSCQCGCVLHRDTNAAINILHKAKSRGGHPRSNANGVETSTLVGANLLEQVSTVKLESSLLSSRGVSIIY
jgi:transposase